MVFLALKLAGGAVLELAGRDTSSNNSNVVFLAPKLAGGAVLELAGRDTSPESESDPPNKSMVELFLCFNVLLAGVVWCFQGQFQIEYNRQKKKASKKVLTEN